MPSKLKEKVYLRIENAIEKYGLDEQSHETFACPIFEKGVGCLVHKTAKPLPCIAHACYERKVDLPPEELLAEREVEIDKLNERVYGMSILLPLPVAIQDRRSLTVREG